MNARRLVAILLSLLALGTTCAPAIATAAVKERAGVTQMYDKLMCVVCQESLAVAQSPEAFQERQQVQQYVADGLTVKQIENRMVANYGTAVLALPPAHGFNLLIYVVPPLVVIVGIITLAFTIPRWRRRARQTEAEPVQARAAVSDADSQRLDGELAKRL